MIEDSAQSPVLSGTRSATATVEVYDFGRPAALSREHARVLELAFETFVRQWAPQLAARIGGRVHIAVEAVTMETYAEYADSLPASTTMVVCALPDTEGRVILQFPLSTATSWIVQMVGGRPTAMAEDRVLTPIEQALIRALTTEAVESLTHTMNGLLPSGATVVGVHYNSQIAQAAAAGDLVVVAQLSMRLGGRTAPASVMLPAEVVLAGITMNGPSTVVAPPGLMRRQVEESPVELALRLAPRTVRPNEVLSLSIGDLVPIPHAADRPLELVVGGQAVAAAAVGTSGARLACVVTAMPHTAAPAEEIA